MPIYGTSSHLPQSWKTGTKLKDSLLYGLRINGALSHLLYPTFKVLDEGNTIGIWLTPSIVYFNYFCTPEVISISGLLCGRFRWPFKFSDRFLYP